MVFRTALFLLVANLSSVQLWYYNPINKCNFKYKMTVGQLVAIDSPHWPNTYRASENCTWTFDCPFGHFCQLRCYYVVMPYSAGCSKDRLMVSTRGNTDFRNATAYCGRTYIKSRSTGTKIILGLITSRKTPGGRFRCAVKTEPVMRIRSCINTVGVQTDYKTLRMLRGHRLPLTEPSSRQNKTKPLSSKSRHFETSTRTSVRNGTYFPLFEKRNFTTTTATRTASVTKKDYIVPFHMERKPTERYDNPPIIQTILQAIRLETNTRIPTKKVADKTNLISPLDSLIQSLGLKFNHNVYNKRLSPPETKLHSPILPKETIPIELNIPTSTELSFNQSFFDAFIEAMGFNDNNLMYPRVLNVEYSE